MSKKNYEKALTLNKDIFESSKKILGAENPLTTISFQF